MTEMRAGRLDVGVIGSGRVGPILARALAGAGHRIVGITASDDAARERVDAMLPGVPVRDLDDVVRHSDLVLFAIPGDELPQLVNGLTAAEVWRSGQILAHTAPEHGHSVFAPALAAGVIPLALHPGVVFSGTSLDLERLHDTRIAVTAPAPVLPIAQALAIEMGGDPVIIQDEDRAAYAEALSAARDFSQQVVSNAVESLRGIGIETPAAILGPLVHAAIDEILVATRDGENPEPLPGEDDPYPGLG